MRARWVLLKRQAAHDRSATLPVDVPCVFFPTESDPSVRRTRRAFEGPIFTEHFPTHIPVHAIEYDNG